MAFKSSFFGFLNLSITQRMKKCISAPINVIKREENSLLLEQTLEPIPGESIQVRGEFERMRGGFRSFIPKKESFKLFVQKTPPPFATPYLNGCWLFSQALLPLNMQNPEGLDRWEEELETTTKLSQELEPGKKGNTKLKKLHHLCSEIYTNEKKTFIELHQKLFFNLFHEELKTDCLLELSKAYRLANELYVLKPAIALTAAWGEQKNHKLLSHDPDIALESARTILHRKMLEAKKVKDPLVSLIGSKLFAPSFEVILQHQSEIIQFAPPELSPLAKKMQALALFQQTHFLFLMESTLFSEQELTYYLIDQFEMSLHLLEHTDETTSNRSLQQYFQEQWDTFCMTKGSESQEGKEEHLHIGQKKDHTKLLDRILKQELRLL